MSQASVSKEHVTAGIDTGSSAVKVAVVASHAGEEARVLSTHQERIRRRNVREVVATSFERALSEAGVAMDELDYVASTGDADAVDFHTGHFYSMTTHARGALFLDPEVRSSIDVGALHARAVRLNEQGKVLGHRMTSQCASGSGQFLENIARYLGVPIDDVGPQSLTSKEPEKCSGVCAVLAETDVINMVSRGISTADILKGIHQSIASRLVRLLRAVQHEGGTALVTGGLAQDVGLLAAMREIVDKEVETGKPALAIESNPLSVYAGALGAAVLGAFRYEQLERSGRLPGVGVAA